MQDRESSPVRDQRSTTELCRVSCASLFAYRSCKVRSSCQHSPTAAQLRMQIEVDPVADPEILARGGELRVTKWVDQLGRNPSQEIFEF